MDNIINIIKENQFLLTTLGLSSAGLLTFWIKDVPLRIFHFIKNRFILSLEIETGTYIHKYLPSFIAENVIKRNFHTYIVTNSMSYYHGSEEQVNFNYSDMIPGVGKHIIKLYNRLYILSISEESKNNQVGNRSSSKQQTTFGFKFYTFGINKKPIEILANSIELWTRNKIREIIGDQLSIRKYEGGGHYYISNLQKRKMETIFMKESDKELLLRRIQDFYDKEQWYYDMGIPYKLGIMLYGPPGTGKSSLIKSLASYFEKNIIMLSPTNIDMIAEANSYNSFVVIEDVDTVNVTENRVKKEYKYEFTQNGDGSNTTTPVENFKLSTLSDVLNAMDGIATPNKFIFIMTTNHIDKLDQALFRPGRIDLLIKMDYVTNEILQDFIDYYFPDSNIDVLHMDIKHNISTSKLQNFIINGDDLDTILDYCKKQERYLEVV